MMPCDSISGYVLALLSVLNLAASSRTSPTLQDARIIVYSNGPCLVVKRLLSDLASTVGDVKLKFGEDNCHSSSRRWISAIDYVVDSQDNLRLIWADSKSSQIFTGLLDLTGQRIVNTEELPVGLENGTFIRSLALNRRQKVIYLSLPKQKAITVYDLSNSSSYTVYKERELGQVRWSDAFRSLFWIQNDSTLCRAVPDRNLTSSCLIFAASAADALQSFVIDTEMHHIYLFFQHGKILRTDLNRINTLVITNNSLGADKYDKALFYTARMLKSTNGQWLKFYTSDALHQSFRIASFLCKGNGSPHRIHCEMDTNNTDIEFVDMPNIYDFVFLDPGLKDRSINWVPPNRNSWFQVNSPPDTTAFEEEEQLFESLPAVSRASITKEISINLSFCLLTACIVILVLFLGRKMISLSSHKKRSQPSFWEIDSIKQNLTDVKF